MRVLMVTPYVPSPLKPRPLAFAISLASDADVHVVCPDDFKLHELGPLDGVGIEGMLERGIKIHRIKMHASTSAFRAASRIISGGSIRGSLYGCNAVQRQVARLCATIAPDILHIDRERMFPIAASIGIPKIVDLTDPIGEALDWKARTRTTHIRHIYSREANAVWRDEARIAKKCPVSFASKKGLDAFKSRISECDAFHISHPALPTLDVSANASLAPLARQSSKRLKIAFVGNLNYWPNETSAIWFATEVLPKLQQLLPGSTLRMRRTINATNWAASED